MFFVVSPVLDKLFSVTVFICVPGATAVTQSHGRPLTLVVLLNGKPQAFTGHVQKYKGYSMDENEFVCVYGVWFQYYEKVVG